MNISNEEYNEIKNAAEIFYRNIGSIFCPFFDKEVRFNIKGLNHIKMKSWNRSRSFPDQYLRLKFIKIAPEIISKSGTLQEFKEIIGLERFKNNGKWEEKQRNIRYYAFIGIIRGIRVKIIIKQVSKDSIFFWSIIPFWKHEKDKVTGKIKKVFHEGDLESQ